MTTKKTVLLSLSFLFIMAAFTGCIPEELLPTVEYDITDLYGKWESGTEYYEYFSDGTGRCWDEGDGVYADEAQKFTWEVDESEMIHIHKAEMGFDVPDHYILTELTASTLKYYDAIAPNKTYSFIKVY